MPDVTPAKTLSTAPAPVLPYARDAGGLEVDRTADVFAIDIPARVRVRISNALCAAAAVAAALVALVGAGTYVLDIRWPRAAIGALGVALIAFCATFFLMLFIMYWSNQSARIEVTADAVRLTVSGHRLHYTNQWPRSQVLDVQHRFHGVRLSLRGRRRGGWIAFGTTEQQKVVCARLREALGLPPRS